MKRAECSYFLTLQEYHHKIFIKIRKAISVLRIITSKIDIKFLSIFNIFSNCLVFCFLAGLELVAIYGNFNPLAKLIRIRPELLFPHSTVA